MDLNAHRERGIEIAQVEVRKESEMPLNEVERLLQDRESNSCRNRRFSNGLHRSSGERTSLTSTVAREEN